MKSILFNAFADKGHPQRLDLALDLARAFDGHLSVLNAVPYEAAGTIDPYGAAFAAMVPIWREEAAKLKAETEKDLANEGVAWDWIDCAGPVSLSLIRHSTLADLIVIGEKEPRSGGKSPSFTAGEVALGADCPVLVLPDECKRLDFDKTAVVAWDGSSESSHALRAAVPLLAKMKAVYLVTVGEGKKGDKDFDLPAIRGADYLSRHGIGCEIVQVAADDKGVAHAIQSAADTRDAGLIVMGCYGRLRLAERLFGGVTRAMLTDVKVPLLLKH
ncbi:universal stress protein [Erythrobacter aquimaris]|uniref:Universal stress protein n=1 Tax=Qipengyuania aquimaris TaxID=255984 RepID=A0A6I4TGZ4_9SPHN|nr:universal stress protein [Qipengyuania aquimaris]MXO95154.1 universal stress protein [Qipengyuania aquimaris]